MIKILKKEIVSYKYGDFVNDEIIVDNICLAVPYDNKCDIYLANGMKITVVKEVYERIEQKTEKAAEKESWPQKIGKKLKR